MKKMLAAVILAALPAPAMACSFDTDCNVGSSCVKRGGQLYGICVGGLNPGRPEPRRDDPYDWQRYQRQQRQQQSTNPLDINRTEGKQCSFDTDCGPGSSCLKSGIYGVCIRG